MHHPHESDYYKCPKNLYTKVSDRMANAEWHIPIPRSSPIRVYTVCHSANLSEVGIMFNKTLDWYLSVIASLTCLTSQSTPFQSCQDIASKFVGLLLELVKWQTKVLSPDKTIYLQALSKSVTFTFGSLRGSSALNQYLTSLQVSEPSINQIHRCIQRSYSCLKTLRWKF